MVWKQSLPAKKEKQAAFNHHVDGSRGVVVVMFDGVEKTEEYRTLQQRLAGGYLADSGWAAIVDFFPSGWGRREERRVEGEKTVSMFGFFPVLVYDDVDDMGGRNGVGKNNAIWLFHFIFGQAKNLVNK